jgi:acyl dehydratase
VQFGRYYEEFEVGAVYKHWPGKTVTEYDDHLFCLLTMNHHPLHLDAQYAATTQQGRNVVVGNYVYSLLLGMSVADVSGRAIANLEVESLKHVFPTFHGDTGLRPDRGAGQEGEHQQGRPRCRARRDQGYNQDGVLICTFRRKVMIPKRSYAAAHGGEFPGRPSCASSGPRTRCDGQFAPGA